MNRLFVYLRRFKQHFKEAVDQPPNLNEVQLMAIKTCRKMICNPNAELIYAPLTQTYYVESDRYYIRMFEDSVTITNGKFSYYVWIPGRVMFDLKSLFNRISQAKSNRLESRYDKSTLQNLKEICDSVNNS